MSTAKDRPKPLAWLTPRERAAYIGLVALRSATGVLDVCGLLLIGLLVAVATGSSAAQRPLAMLGMDPEDVDTSTIMVLVALVAALFLAKAAVGVGAAQTLAWYVAVIEARRADDIADYVFSDDLTTLDGRDRGQIVWAITGSVSALFTGMLTVRAIMISETITAVLIGATIAVSNPIVGAGVLLYLVLLFWGIHMVVSRRIRRAGRQTARGSVGTGNALDDLIGSYREISVLGVREVFLSRLSVAKRAVALSTAVKLFLGAMPRYIAESGLMLGLVAFVAVEALSGNLAQNLPSLAIFLAGGVRLIGSLLPIQTAVGMGRNFAAQSDLASSLLRDRADAGSGAAAPAETDATPPADFTLVLDRVSYTHPGAAEAAVREISLEIPQGTRVAIVGPSGAGKSTLADLMLGLLSPAEGSVTLGGTPMRQARSGAAGAIAYVPQRPGIVEGTIADNIALGVPAEERSVRRLNAAVRAAHLGELLASLPQGLDTPVDPRSDSLSGGQLQRLGLARAFYHEPKLLVLDEPTSALDPQTEAAVADTLRLLGDDVTTVVIAHRLSTVQHADVVLVLDAGRVVASGSLSELATSNALVAEYVRLSTIALSA